MAHVTDVPTLPVTQPRSLLLMPLFSLALSSLCWQYLYFLFNPCSPIYWQSLSNRTLLPWKQNPHSQEVIPCFNSQGLTPSKEFLKNFWVHLQTRNALPRYFTFCQHSAFPLSYFNTGDFLYGQLATDHQRSPEQRRTFPSCPINTAS